MCVISCIIFQDNRNLSLCIREVLGYILQIAVSRTMLVRVSEAVRSLFITWEALMVASPSRGGLPDLRPFCSPRGSSPLCVPGAGGSAGPRWWSWGFPVCSTASLFVGARRLCLSASARSGDGPSPGLLLGWLSTPSSRSTWAGAHPAGIPVPRVEGLILFNLALINYSHYLQSPVSGRYTNRAEGGCVVASGALSFVCVAFYYGTRGEEPGLYSSRRDRTLVLPTKSPAKITHILVYRHAVKNFLVNKVKY